jgi:hypothetical protein
MTRASDDLVTALAALRRAANRDLGEDHKGAAQAIDELAQLAGWDNETAVIDEGAATPSLKAALTDVRKLAERELAGNAYYLASVRLDALGRLPARPSAPAEEPAPQATAAPAETPIVSVPDATSEGTLGANFDEISAAAKARVEAIAAKLGVEIVHHHEITPALARHVETPPPAAELEPRSSEPCSMAELLPPEIAPAAFAAAAPVEAATAASVREVVEATHDLGSPAVEAKVEPAPAPEPEPAPVVEAKVEPTPAPEPEPAPVVEAKVEPAPAPEPAPAAKKVEEAPAKGPIPKAQQKGKEPQKSFFGIWLDMVFGRRK